MWIIWLWFSRIMSTGYFVAHFVSIIFILKSSLRTHFIMDFWQTNNLHIWSILVSQLHALQEQKSFCGDFIKSNSFKYSFVSIRTIEVLLTSAQYFGDYSNELNNHKNILKNLLNFLIPYNLKKQSLNGTILGKLTYYSLLILLKQIDIS